MTVGAQSACTSWEAAFTPPRPPSLALNAIKNTLVATVVMVLVVSVLVLELVELLLVLRRSSAYPSGPTGLALNSMNPMLVATVLVVVVVKVVGVFVVMVGVVVVEVARVLVLVASVMFPLLLLPISSPAPPSGALQLDLTNTTSVVLAPRRPTPSSRDIIPTRRGCAGGRPPPCQGWGRFVGLRAVAVGCRSRRRRHHRHAGRFSPANGP